MCQRMGNLYKYSRRICINIQTQQNIKSRRRTLGYSSSRLVHTYTTCMNSQVSRARNKRPNDDYIRRLYEFIPSPITSPTTTNTTQSPPHCTHTFAHSGSFINRSTHSRGRDTCKRECAALPPNHIHNLSTFIHTHTKSKSSFIVSHTHRRIHIHSRAKLPSTIKNNNNNDINRTQEPTRLGHRYTQQPEHLCICNGIEQHTYT